MLDKAILIAIQVHAGQKDKAEKPYILHPIRVMMKVDSDEEKITAVLHDVIEDSKGETKWTIDRLRSEGFPENILEALDNLTKKENEPYDVFIKRAKKAQLSRKVKLADIEDNMDIKRITTLKEKDLERLEKYHRSWLELKNAELAPDALTGDGVL